MVPRKFHCEINIYTRFHYRCVFTLYFNSRTYVAVDSEGTFVNICVYNLTARSVKLDSILCIYEPTMRKCSLTTKPNKQDIHSNMGTSSNTKKSWEFTSIILDNPANFLINDEQIKSSALIRPELTVNFFV